MLHFLPVRLHVTRTEIGFFIILFLVLPVLSDIEYNFSEGDGSLPALALVVERLFYGLLKMPLYLLYYKLGIPFLLTKHYLRFLIATLFFLICLNIYMRYGVYATMMHAPFLSQRAMQAARTYFLANVWLHFSLVYVARELLVITTLAYYLRSVAQEQKMYALRQQHAQAELDYLRGQLQPHFYFNTLNNIYALALQQSAQTAPLVARHAEIMHYMLYQTHQATVLLQQEIDFLRNYAAVESMRYAENITVDFETQGVFSSASIEPLLLLPFVENTFKHGVQEETQSGYIRIVCVLLQGELLVDIQNSKPAVSHQSTRPPGIGLVNARKRLALLYPRRHSLEINEEAQHYTVRLMINLHVPAS